MTERTVRPRRSFIFTPGLRPDMYPKALACGTDIVCVELEDGIAPKDKAEARANALALFAEPQADDGVERIVRINSLRERFGVEDVNAILAARTPPPALMMPKVRRPDTERAQATFDWAPQVDLAEGLERTLPWFQERVDMTPLPVSTLTILR